MNKHIFIILIILIIAGAGYLWFQGAQENTTPATPSEDASEQNEHTDEPTQTNPQQDWEAYASPDSETLGFRMEHPADTSVRQVAEGIYEIKYIGPESEANTEITDGYLLSMQFIATTSPQTYAELSDIASTSVAVTVAGWEAHRFQTESVQSSELVTHFAFRAPTDASTTVDISVQTYGDDGLVYEDEVFAILRTLTFTGSIDTPDASDSSDTLIRVSTPAHGASVDDPIELSGEARGQWYFEADAPVVVVDWDGRIIGESFITAEDDWMTEDFVPFSGSVSYELPKDSYSASGTVIFQRANPSGLPENDAAVEVPVILE